MKEIGQTFWTLMELSIVVSGWVIGLRVIVHSCNYKSLLLLFSYWNIDERIAMNIDNDLLWQALQSVNTYIHIYIYVFTKLSDSNVYTLRAVSPCKLILYKSFTLAVEY